MPRAKFAENILGIFSTFQLMVELLVPKWLNRAALPLDFWHKFATRP
jgi:hypothetical protein